MDWSVRGPYGAHMGQFWNPLVHLEAVLDSDENKGRGSVPTFPAKRLDYYKAHVATDWNMCIYIYIYIMYYMFAICFRTWSGHTTLSLRHWGPAQSTATQQQQQQHNNNNHAHSYLNLLFIPKKRQPKALFRSCAYERLVFSHMFINISCVLLFSWMICYFSYSCEHVEFSQRASVLYFVPCFQHVGKLQSVIGCTVYKHIGSWGPFELP
jgi:ABC-type maltose transport system permease subunit